MRETSRTELLGNEIAGLKCKNGPSREAIVTCTMNK